MPSIAREINGHHTEVLLQYYADRILVLITQYGKVGSLIQASIPSTAPLLPTSNSVDPNDNPIPQPPTSIQLTPLLASAQSEHMQTLYSLYAAQVATLVWLAEEGALMPTRRNVVVGLALRRLDSGDGGDEEKRVFMQVVDMLREVLLSQ